MSDLHQDLSTEAHQMVTRIFKALSDQNRLRIMYMILQEPSSVGHITHTLSLSQSNVSHQLRVLKEAKLVKSERHGQSMIYSVHDRHVATLIQQAIDHATHH